MTLWFENKFGEEREIAKVNTWEDVYKEINNFIEECNKRNRKEFVVYYFRVWQRDDSRYCIDVGSHTEFFITDVPYK